MAICYYLLMSMNFKQKDHDQIYCDYVQDEIYGGANCPFCNMRCALRSLNGRLVAEDSCGHVDMAVHAGNFEIAIMFRLNTKS